MLGVGFYKGVPEKNLFSITHATWWSLVNAVLLGAASMVLLVYFAELVMHESVKKTFFWGDFPLGIGVKTNTKLLICHLFKIYYTCYFVVI